MKKINIDDECKHRDPFVVPDGYFDNLSDRVMRRIEQQAADNATLTLRRSSRISLIWRCSAAASVALLLGIGVLHYNATHIASQYDENEWEDVYYLSETASDDEWDAAVDYAVLGNQDIAYYLTEAY